jgi:succinoglycan biosynthesis protein ExoA
MVVPVRNEATHIDTCLAALVDQTYPANLVEILVVDGMSTDDTVSRVKRWIERDERVRLIENPARIMPSGLNLAIEASSADVIGVVSGHSTVRRDYIQRVIHTLRRTGAWCVGCGIRRRATTPRQRAIARATSSPIGVGDAVHNYAREAGWVESVFPGMWPRWVFERVGLFDPAMTYNEDNEFSYRIRMAGGRIWYEPSIMVDYVPRGSLRGAFQQYRRYARGRVAVFRKHGGGLGWRHLVPPAWVAWLAVAPVVGLWWSQAWVLLAISVLAYLGIVLAAAARNRVAGDSLPLTVASFAAIHAGYGLGIIQGLIDWIRKRRS